MHAYSRSAVVLRLAAIAAGFTLATFPEATFAAHVPSAASAPAVVTTAAPTAATAAPKKKKDKVDAATSKQCTIPKTIDLETEKGNLPDVLMTTQDRVCFRYKNAIRGDDYTYDLVEVSLPPPLLSWSDVSQVMGVISSGASKAAEKAGGGAKATSTTLLADLQSDDRDPTEVQAGDATGYSLGPGYSLTITIKNLNRTLHKTSPVVLTVKVPKTDTVWTTYIGAIAPTGRWDRAYTLEPVGNGTNSRIQDSSPHDGWPSRLYGSMFWIRNTNPNFNWAAGFGLNGGHVTGFAGGGTDFSGVGLIYGVAFVPTDELTQQYQYNYSRHRPIPSTTSVSSLTTLKYRMTLFVGLGVTFCISSCPTDPNAKTDQTAGKKQTKSSDDSGG